jgi:hypothetical protein
VLLPQTSHNIKKFLTVEDVPGSVRSDDKNFQDVWKPVYCHYLFDEKRRHDKIFCGDNNAISKSLWRVVNRNNEELNCYRWVEASRGVYRRFIYIGNREETSAQVLVLDVDAPGCWGKWAEWGLPCPHLEVINPQSGNVQWHYLLKNRVYDMEAYHASVQAMNALVRFGRDKDGNKNMQYRSPFLKVVGKRKTKTLKNGVSIHSRKGRMQAFYALVIPHDVDDYTLQELLEGCRAVDVETVDKVANEATVTVQDYSNPEHRNSWMFGQSWKLCCEQYRQNGGTITETEVYGFYKDNASDLEDDEVQRSVTRCLKWISQNHDYVMSFKERQFKGGERWSPNHVGWKTIASGLGVSVKTAQRRFTYEKAIDELYRLQRNSRKKSLSIVPSSSVLQERQKEPSGGTGRDKTIYERDRKRTQRGTDGTGNDKNPEVLAIMEANPRLTYPTAKKRWQRANARQKNGPVVEPQCATSNFT